jgi:hypothetical protein
MNKYRILFAFKAYPLTMAHYFLRALQRRDDVEVKTVGEFYGQYIPWGGGMTIPMKYLNKVDIPLPKGMDNVPYSLVKSQLGGWEPDLVLNVDAGFHFSTKPDVPYSLVATDPHVLGDWYAKVRPHADYLFNMQPAYMQTGDILLPYAFDPLVHWPDTTVQKEYDCVLVGLHYPQRDEWVRRLQAKGMKVNYRLGDIYDTYREENCKATIGLNWSSLEDVTARVFELMAMRLVPVLNRLSALDYFGFEDGRHYLGFSSMDEAVDKVMWAKENPQFAQQIANQAYQFVYERGFTWDNRIRLILEKVGFLDVK